MTECEALAICKEKAAAHELEMKLIKCQIDEEENKTTFYFTADGRVDFRELVKDLAAIFHNRIELRQIGVRDETKLLGGLGICGRPYCCKEFLDDFAPVSTKMAKIQSLSLNPAKISGSCGRLMCCLRYEEDAYEELVKTVPKQGAFVETPDGYGTAVSIDLLRQNVKVHLDDDPSETTHEYKAKAVASVPGGRPKDGEIPPHVLNYNPDEDEEPIVEAEDPWSTPEMFISESDSDNKDDASNIDSETENIPAEPDKHGKRRFNRRRRPKTKKPSEAPVSKNKDSGAAPEKAQKKSSTEVHSNESGDSVQEASGAHAASAKHKKKYRGPRKNTPGKHEKPKEV